ncbi:hypothetical protein PPL_04541 [Heterostelium album PN500]|uniref:Armadillo repeat-containing protein 1 n=1 Tax=Heterostelium pallidum (strain ATCC 26659 / Pp 5 / PN500) TaxID=670386 RepID=D3B7V3_HETP5|nr:hypothetical protein PPL_04541 [Heterostelium album PN500]EFA82846.1 hypothetical protein PPL_04541 [Heterostelium album PN500]|eukprot:XP_020434963.1 hypothetical protein PPL_04541 [Heterostelium album PN500]
MSLAVVQQLYNLSVDPDHREMIVKDQGCLPALVLFLSSTEEGVAKTSIDTLELLSQNQANKDHMLREPALLSSLKSLQEKIEYKDTILKIINRLEVTTNDNINNNSKSNNINLNNNINNFTTTPSNKPATSFSVLVGDKFGTGGSKVATNSNANAKTIILFIKGMNNESSKKQVEDCLLRTKGVISFMIDLNTYQATIRCTITADEIKAVLRYQLGLSASLMIDGREEVDNSPDYLPEDNPAFANQPKRSAWGWNSIVSFGISNDTNNNKQPQGNWGWGSISKALFG